MQWRLASRGHFYDRDEGIVIYFDPRTGDTHLISQFAAFLLAQLRAGSVSLELEEVIAQMTPYIAPEGLAESIRAIPAILDDLAELDIIERV